MLYKKEGLPEENEIVICTIKKILPNSVFVDLDEYKNREGLIHISEISPGRIRNIRDFVKEGKKIVCKVLRIDRTKGNIDLSLRRVAQSQKINKNNEYKQEIRSEKILEAVAKQNDLTLEEMYNKVGYKLIEEYGTLNVCFEELSKNQEILKQLKLDKKLEKDIITIVKEKIKPKIIKISGIFKITSTLPDGIEVIKETIKKVVDYCKKENAQCEILYSGAPSYRVVIESQSYKEAEKHLEKMVEIAKSNFKGKGNIDFIRNEKRNL